MAYTCHLVVGAAPVAECQSWNQPLGLGMAEPRATGKDSVGNIFEAMSDRSWLVAYTRSRHEYAVAHQLECKNVSFLLPSYSKASRWSDRTKRALVPLFPSYVFVHVTDDERVRVLQTAGVVNIVSVAGKPAPLRDTEVAMLRECVARPDSVKPHAFLHLGQRVRVKQGPFTGCEGVLAGKKNSSRLVVSMQQIMQSISIDLDGADVEAVK